MRTKAYLSVVVFALLCVVGWSAYGQRQGGGKAEWEYRSVSIQSGTYYDEGDKRFNEMGRQGWELVAAINREDRGRIEFVFKRAK
ncbi:MAG TPA: hypothetical protein VF538_11445 [Pyrinomonadaceae bacterium]